MNDYKRLNRILGWLVFAIATLVYFLTLEPTASWWDCGEYIATAYKLQVGHPPGAPTFQLIVRNFTLFAFGDTSKLALMINAMSALSSSFTILFLFWTITLLGRKIIGKEGMLQRGNMIAVLGSGVVGALAFTFSDSFWFSAVEGEVYAMSSLFTAITFWAILKWESVADEEHSLRWIILIIFLIGVSIGVHLLNLLAIPAISFVYYFKKYKVTTKGVLVVFGLSILILAIIMYLIIPGVVSLSGAFELFFVNSLGMPFHSGTIIYFVLLIGLIILGHQYTKRKKMVIANTIVLGLVFLMIGYSSFFLLIIRSNANVPIDENNPEDAVGLLSYLNREQYGSTPVFHGQYYNAPIKIENGDYVYKDGTPVRIRDDEAGRYIVTDNRKRTIPVYDPRFTTIFPGMWSSQKQIHIDLYKQFGKVKGIPITVTRGDGNPEVINKPTFIENMRFFFSYQLSHMYFRYLFWNFVGRQNDIESQGEPNHGNWVSGINFIDSMRLGSQSDLPKSMESPAHNKFYFLPLLLGLAGFFFHLGKSKKDTLVVGLLFLMTGVAIVVFLNQYPLQPRERDYAYTGSFYAFSIWIGFGVLAIYDYLVKWIKKKEFAAIGATVATLILVPALMAQQSWDDHDRSGKYAARDFAFNYLASCDQNAVLITFGDNDTFPLWYAQEVEEFRTDIRVVNHMLASGSWYVQQMFRKAYDSDPLKLTLTSRQYEKGINDYVPVYDRGIKGYTELKDVIDWVASENEQTKLTLQGGKKMNYLPTKKVRLTIDSAKCVDNGIVPLELADKIVPYIDWEIRQSALYKNDLMLLDFLATDNFERPFYVANPSSLGSVLGLDQYFHQEGMVYKFMPVKAKNYIRGVGGVSGEKSYEIFVNDCRWGRLNEPGISVDRESYRNSRLPRQNYLRTAEVLMQEGEKEKAIKLLDECIYYFPNEKFTYDMLMLPFAELYFEGEELEKGLEILSRLVDRYEEDLYYYDSLKPEFASAHYDEEIRISVTVLNRIGELASKNGDEELAERVDLIIMGEQLP